MEPFPERLERDGLVLARWTIDDVDALSALVAANVDHLRARMPWIADEPVGPAQRRALLEEWDEAWRAGREAVYRMELDGVAVGSCGLHDRLGPDEREIGYWVDHRHLGRGLATRAAAALTDAVFATPLAAVEILHDRTNDASRRVPEKLGFADLGERASDRPQAPADSGWDRAWRMERGRWLSR